MEVRKASMAICHLPGRSWARSLPSLSRAQGSGEEMEEGSQPSGRAKPRISSRLLPETVSSISVRSHMGMPSSMTR